MIQITAPISPGSSGEGLFDTDGNLIGITTAYVEGGQNLNLAVPINVAKHLLTGSVPLKPLIEVANEQRTQVRRVSTKDVVNVLKVGYCGFDTPSGRITFTFSEGILLTNNDENTVRVWGTMKSDSYVDWLLLDQEGRMRIVRRITEGLTETTSGLDFYLTLFYQDYWVTFPHGFDPKETSLSVDGRFWLVTRAIGGAFSGAQGVRYWARP